jgi:hypothetical protein
MGIAKNRRLFGYRVPSDTGMLQSRQMTETKERKQLDDLKRSPAKHRRRSDAKTFKLPLAALKIIEKAGEVHGQQSRAIQVAVELLWHSVGAGIPDADMSAMKESALTIKTYRLPPRTVDLIQSLSHEYGTQGNVLAACAYMLSKPDPRGRLRAMRPSLHKKKKRSDS